MHLFSQTYTRKLYPVAKRLAVYVDSSLPCRSQITHFLTLIEQHELPGRTVEVFLYGDVGPPTPFPRQSQLAIKEGPGQARKLKRLWKLIKIAFSTMLNMLRRNHEEVLETPITVETGSVLQQHVEWSTADGVFITGNVDVARSVNDDLEANCELRTAVMSATTLENRRLLVLDMSNRTANRIWWGKLFQGIKLCELVFGSMGTKMKVLESFMRAQHVEETIISEACVV